MNRLRMKFLGYASLIIFLTSCGQSDQDAAPKKNTRFLESDHYEQLSDSIKRFPDQVELRLRRATLLSQNNLHDKATEDYQKSWEMTGDENVGLEYASNLLMTDKVSKAIKFLEEGSQKFPDNSEYSRRLAEIYMQNGEPGRAIREYDKIIAIDSSNFEAWYDKGTLMLRIKDTAGAIAALENSFSILPINYSGMALANIYVARKDPRALEIADILLSRDTTGIQTEPVFIKGMYYSDINDDANAIKQFDECIKRDWKMTDAYIEKGIIIFEKKKYDEALKVFNMAATVSNTDPDAYYWMGRCFEASGNKDEAITNYERALSLDNSLSEARSALERLNS